MNLVYFLLDFDNFDLDLVGTNKTSIYATIVIVN